MENTESQKFDNAWRNVFQQAEQDPSSEVWSALDSELTRAEGTLMKRKVVFYQRLAAASVIFALVFGSVTTYFNLRQNVSPGTNSSVNQSTIENGNLNQGASESELAGNLAKKETMNVSPELLANSRKHKSNESPIVQQKQAGFIILTKSDSGSREVVYTQEPKVEKSKIAANYLHVFSVHAIPSPDVKISGELREVTIVRKLPAMPASFMADTRKQKRSGEDLWASIGASAGYYSPQANLNSNAYTTGAGSFAGASSNSATSDAYSQGSAYSIGMSVSKRVANHWIVQGGLSYLNQAIGYTSNFASVTAANKASAYVADYATINQNAATVTLTNPYEISSMNQFVSLPIQAGYLLVDRKFGWQLNTGLSTDIFLQNTLTDKSGQLDSYSKGAGDDSPYRTLSWSALMGTELSYRIGTQYRFSLAPGLRYTVSPVFKSDAVSGNPIVWDLGFRFRYIFN